MKINIAIDGYSSCGKGTLAKFLAKQLNYTFIDSGAMYRAVTYYAIKQGINNQNINNIISMLNNINISFKYNQDSDFYETILNNVAIEDEIRTLEVANFVSPISKILEVRKFLVAQQQEIGKNKGIVMDGRDIGTVVFPDAELKIFMTASAEVRAKRRFKEFQKIGKDITYNSVYNNLIERDLIDSTRENSPLLKAQDALELDNTFLTYSEQEKIALEWALKKINFDA